VFDPATADSEYVLAVDRQGENKEFDMNVMLPNGLVERMSERQERLRSFSRYGRKKDGAPMNAESWKIADDNDRRERSRPDSDPFRGRLVDLDA
jgi:hypothetical protein